MKHSKLQLFLIALILHSCGPENTDPQATFDLKLFPVEVNNQYSFRDFNGKSIPGSSYEYLTFFYNGISIGYYENDLERGKNVDFINTSGRVLFNSNVMDFGIGNSEIWVSKPNQALQLLKKNGEEIFTAPKDMISVFPYQNGLAAAEFWDSDYEEMLWGFINQSGQIVINPQFRRLESNSYFNDGSCPVRNEDGNYGFIDIEGRLIIPYQFDYCEPFYDDRAIFGKRTKRSLKFGLINEDGLYVISPNYYDIHRDGDIYMVQDDNGWGWIDGDGNVLIAPQFNEALPFNNSKYAPVQMGEDFGFIDKKGRIVVNPQYEFATSFYQGKAFVQDKNGLTGVMGSNLKLDLIPQFEVELPYSSTEEYFRFIEMPKIQSDYFEIQSVVDLVEEFSSKQSLFDMSFGQLSNRYGIELVANSRYHSLTDTTIFSLGFDRSINAQVFLYGQPAELVEKIVGEGFYQRRVEEYELRPEFNPKGILISFEVSPYQRRDEVEQLLVDYLISSGAEADWVNDINSGFDSYDQYRTFTNEEYTYEIFQISGVQYLAIYK